MAVKLGGFAKTGAKVAANVGDIGKMAKNVGAKLGAKIKNVGKVTAASASEMATKAKNSFKRVVKVAGKEAGEMGDNIGDIGKAGKVKPKPKMTNAEKIGIGAALGLTGVGAIAVGVKTDKINNTTYNITQI
jgi:hypothetical protein